MFVCGPLIFVSAWCWPSSIGSGVEHGTCRTTTGKLSSGPLTGERRFCQRVPGGAPVSEHSVAIKILRSQADESALANFLAEARLVSRLVHPHIIRVLDFGLDGNVPFLVMDYAPSSSLRRLHPRGTAVPLPTVVSYVQALASGLQYAHDQHLIHRDLKPENVLLGPKHEVLLSDFCLALLTSETDPARVKERFGTLAFLASEAFLGRPGPASDQYALALMTYEWLGGQLPFEGPPDQLADQHLYAVPPSLCARNPEVPPALEHVIFTGLSKEPALRFADVLSFAGAFEKASQAALARGHSYPLATPSMGRGHTMGVCECASATSRTRSRR